MSHKTHVAGVFASAAMLLSLIFAVDGTGANAQTEGAFPAPVPADEAAATLQAAAARESQIRFIASPVVQELPEDVAASDTPDRPGEYASLPELVAATPHEGELAGELRCLAQAVYFEARGEPLAGQLAVARVVVNRSASGIFPEDYCSVVTQRAQFSFVRGGRIPAADERSAAWQRAVRVARIAHQDLWPSDVGDALFFHADHVRPRWANRKIARATIDSHIFYR